MHQANPDYMQVPLLDMPLTAQTWSLYIFSTLAVLTILWSLYRSRQEKSATPFLYAIGGGLTCVLEPILARLADATHAQVGQITAFESLGLLIPWHAAISYTFYFGLAYILLIPPFRDRVYTPKKIWSILAIIVVSAWIYEAPLVSIGLWKYFGDQPYQPFGLMPIWWTAASAAMLIVPTTLIARYDHILQGWKKIFIVPMTAMGSVAGAAAVCWPTWLVLHSHAGKALQWGAATLTIALSCLAVWLVIPLISRQEA